MAAIAAVAVNTDGRRESLGMTTGNSEPGTFRTEALRGLARRGLSGVEPVVSDAHEGFKAAADRVPGATAQRCRVRSSRDAMAHAGESQRRIVSARIGTASAQNDAASARPR